MSGLSLHQAVFQGCGVVSLKGSRESVGAPSALPPIPRSLAYRFPSVIIQDSRLACGVGRFFPEALPFSEKMCQTMVALGDLSMTGVWLTLGKLLCS